VGELTERRPLCGSGGTLQIPRLAEFPVGIAGVGELHAVFSYGKPHTWMCLEAAWQETRLAEFPVKNRSFGGFHAALFTESRIRGRW
jgi:hypothetical protein